MTYICLTKIEGLMIYKCGKCDLTNRDVEPCKQCKRFQYECNQRIIKVAESYERLFRDRKSN